MAREKNPIYTRWHDPFAFMSKDYIIGKGDGNIKRGYDRIIDEFITNWNKGVDNGSGMPRTSKERGLEWIPTIGKNGEIIKVEGTELSAQ